MNSFPAVTPLSQTSVPTENAPGDRQDFHVHLENFSGPFDLLLSLIAKHKLDITEISLAAVTDEFISYIRMADFAEVEGNTLLGRDARRNLGLASEFLLVAATLLDLKAARLLPDTDLDDQDANELLEARDLLFSKLLQYRAFKHLAGSFAERLESQADFLPRATALEPELAALLPPLVWTLTPDKLAALARTALGEPEQVIAPLTVSTSHLHGAPLSVADEAPAVISQLRAAGTLTFEQLTATTNSALVTVIRFLILLELFRESQITFTQGAPLETLHITWVGDSDYVPYALDDYTGHPAGREVRS